MLQISADGTSNLVRLQSLDYLFDFYPEHQIIHSNLIRRGEFICVNAAEYIYNREGDTGVTTIHLHHPVTEYRQYHGSRPIGLFLYTHR